MPRANRNFCAGLVWHITHRCHRRQFLLKFRRDRRRWRHWLYVARRRYGLVVLDYVATSNHVHLMLVDQGEGEIARSMQLIAGRTAQEFNRRKGRHGAYWEDRYHATAVQTGTHLVRCMTYVDLNMVRAGAVAHPRDWDVSGYAEIQAPWKRKGVIAFDTLQAYLGVNSREEIAELQDAWIMDELSRTKRNPDWTDTMAIGDESYVDLMRTRIGVRARIRQSVDGGAAWVLKDDGP